MKDKNCVFCKIIDGVIPSYKIYEDDYVFAFLDINPIVEGHTLVIPKKHFVNIFDVEDLYLEKVALALKNISKHYKRFYEGVNILNANDVVAQQTVFHLHFHIIPRFKDDGVNVWPFKEADDKNLKKICEKLKL